MILHIDHGPISRKRGHFGSLRDRGPSGGIHAPMATRWISVIGNHRPNRPSESPLHHLPHQGTIWSKRAFYRIGRCPFQGPRQCPVLSQKGPKRPKWPKWPLLALQAILGIWAQTGHYCLMPVSWDPTKGPPRWGYLGLWLSWPITGMVLDAIFPDTTHKQ